MTTTRKIIDGAARFERFRNTLGRERGNYAWSCLAQEDNLEIWRVVGPTRSTRIIAIIGEDGFDLFHESQAMNFAADHAAIQAIVD